MSQEHKVFVYGSLKKGYSNYRVIKGGSYLGKDKTLYPDWRMFSLGGFPGVNEGDHYITGEVYLVDDDCFASLDRLEGQGSFYTREVVELDKYESAWMYVLPPEYTGKKDDGVVVMDNEQTWMERNKSNDF